MALAAIRNTTVQVLLHGWLQMPTVPWGLRQYRTCLQSRRRGFNPWVREIPWRKKATHSSIFAWRIPWTEEAGRLQSMGSQRVRHDWATTIFTFFFHWGLGEERQGSSHTSCMQDGFRTGVPDIWKWQRQGSRRSLGGWSVSGMVEGAENAWLKKKDKIWVWDVCEERNRNSF